MIDDLISSLNNVIINLDKGGLMRRNSLWMMISGITGFTFFLIANFTNLFIGSAVMAGGIQLFVNAFVFIVWSKAFKQSSGLKKFNAFWGIIVPVIMASITLWRVLLPWVYNLVKATD